MPTKNNAAGRVLSIGQGSRTLEDLVDLLTTNEVAFLIDVRSKPYSKWQPLFSKKPLQQSLKQAGVRYLFLGDGLGGLPHDPECFTEDGRVDYGAVRQKAFFLQALGRLRNAVAQGHTICLFCSEGDPAKCHRSLLVGEALADLETPIRAEHIDHRGVLETQESVVRRAREERSGGQLPLFGPGFTSRKKFAVDD